MGGRVGAVRPRHRLLGVAAALAMAAATAVGARAQEPDQARAARLMDDLMWNRGHVGGPFILTDQNGATRTDADFRGKLMLVYSMYTTCPDICPTDLMQIGIALDKLGSATDLQAVFISDRSESASTTDRAEPSYVGAISAHRILGLTGTPAQIRAVADAYKAYYAPLHAARRRRLSDRPHRLHLSDGPLRRVSGLLPTGHHGGPHGRDHHRASRAARIACPQLMS